MITEFYSPTLSRERGRSRLYFKLIANEDTDREAVYEEMKDQFLKYLPDEINLTVIWKRESIPIRPFRFLIEHVEIGAFTTKYNIFSQLYTEYKRSYYHF